MTEKIFGIVTDSMMYRVGSPIPVVPGYDIEPFLVIGILMVEESPSEASPVVAPAPAGADDAEDPTAPEAVPDVPATEDWSEPKVHYMILAVPDQEELKRHLPVTCPQEQQATDPNWQVNWPMAVRYNQMAHEHEKEGRRVVLTVDSDLVVRTERLVNDDELKRIIADFRTPEETTGEA